MLSAKTLGRKIGEVHPETTACRVRGGSPERFDPCGDWAEEPQLTSEKGEMQLQAEYVLRVL
jgi:hypothetical protein